MKIKLDEFYQQVGGSAYVGRVSSLEGGVATLVNGKDPARYVFYADLAEPTQWELIGKSSIISAKPVKEKTKMNKNTINSAKPARNIHAVINRLIDESSLEGFKYELEQIKSSCNYTAPELMYERWGQINQALTDWYPVKDSIDMVLEDKLLQDEFVTIVGLFNGTTWDY